MTGLPEQNTPLQINDIITRLKALRRAIKRVESHNAKRLQTIDVRKRPYAPQARFYACNRSEADAHFPIVLFNGDTRVPP